MILVVTTRGDVHAHAVQKAVQDLGYDEIHLLECDNLSGRDALSWSSETMNGRVRSRDGVLLEIGGLTAVWWRRVNASQTAVSNSDEHERDLINNDCRGGLAGALSASFDGTWISTPQATSRAADKVLQLRVASKAGFRIPKTLLSQSRADVLNFASTTGRVIVKPVVGAAGPLLFTQFADGVDKLPTASFARSPALYQEYIEGARHLRVNVFGSDVHAALIESEALDWRADLNVPVSSYRLSSQLESKLHLVLAELGLVMGIFDLKLTPEGEPVWLEVNPQGQFLFLEALLGEPLSNRFGQFLVSQSRSRS